MSTLEIKSNTANNEEKLAVECGYFLFSADAIEEPLALLHIWHYNPEEDGQVLKAANTDGKEEMKVSNGFHLDSKEPDWSKLLTAFNLGIKCSQPKHRDFIMGEVRYNSLMKTLPSVTLLHLGKASELALLSTSVTVLRIFLPLVGSEVQWTLEVWDTAPAGQNVHRKFCSFELCPPVLEYTSVSTTTTLTSSPLASTWSRPPKPMS